MPVVMAVVVLVVMVVFVAMLVVALAVAAVIVVVALVVAVLRVVAQAVAVHLWALVQMRMNLRPVVVGLDARVLEGDGPTVLPLPPGPCARAGQWRACTGQG